MNSTLDNIEKGRKAAAQGEIREYSGKKYQKVGKNWVPVKGNQIQKTKIEQDMETKSSPSFEEKIKNIDDVSLEANLFKVAKVLKDSNGKIPKLEDLEDEIDIDLRKKLSIISKEILRRENMETEKETTKVEEESGTPKKIKVTKDREMNSKFGDSYTDKFSIDGVEVASYKRGNGMYHSIKNGTPSNIRNKKGVTNEVRFNREGLKKVLGDKYPSSFKEIN